ncbi:MAG: FAD:protein FMN transferase [Candidatus Parcubacteria bacterium]|nr:FAD:protein FMN transferase [Candidatus Paceibacterota bacterium]
MLLIDGLEALGTKWWVRLTNPEFIPIDSCISQKITGLILNFQLAYSRFDQASLLSQLNQNRKLKNPPAELIEMLIIGIDFYNQTGGLFNIGLENQLRAIGYGKPIQTIELVPDINKLIKITDSHIQLIGRGNIDLGGLGKGYLIELIAKYLRSQGYHNFLINGGGDILVSGDSPQTITLENPFELGISLGQVVLDNQALACSSTAKRSWNHPSYGQVSHIINPKKSPSQAPGNQTASFVVGSSILAADIVATILCIGNQTSYNQEILERLADMYGLVVKVL